jgi:hypothetical protein
MFFVPQKAPLTSTDTLPEVPARGTSRTTCGRFVCFASSMNVMFTGSLRKNEAGKFRQSSGLAGVAVVVADPGAPANVSPPSTFGKPIRKIDGSDGADGDGAWLNASMTSFSVNTRFQKDTM